MNKYAALFRLQYLVYGVVCLLGFAVPWDRWVDLDQGRTSWLALAALPAREGWMSFSGATVAVLIVGIVCAVVGAWMRTWSVVSGGAKQALYAGTLLHTLALAMLMPPSGAAFAIASTGLFETLLLNSSHENPTLAGNFRLRWGAAVVKEIYVWGVAGSFAVLGWRYNAFLLTKCVIVSLGVSLVMRAALPMKKESAA